MGRSHEVLVSFRVHCLTKDPSACISVQADSCTSHITSYNGETDIPNLNQAVEDMLNAPEAPVETAIMPSSSSQPLSQPQNPRNAASEAGGKSQTPAAPITPPIQDSLQGSHPAVLPAGGQSREASHGAPEEAQQHHLMQPPAAVPGLRSRWSSRALIPSPRSPPSVLFSPASVIYQK